MHNIGIIILNGRSVLHRKADGKQLVSLDPRGGGSLQTTRLIILMTLVLVVAMALPFGVSAMATPTDVTESVMELESIAQELIIQGSPDISEHVQFTSPAMTPTASGIRVEVEDCRPAGPPGGPSLPLFTKTYNLPAKVSPTIVVETSQPSILPMGGSIMTEPIPEVPSMDGWEPSQAQNRGPEIFASGEVWPPVWYETTTSQCLDPVLHEDVTQVTVHIYPVRYDTDNGNIHSITDAQVSISYDEPTPTSRASRSISCDMVIICPATMVSSFDSLVQHKNASGIMTKVVTLTQIYDGTYFTVQGSDNAEKMKYFIKDAKESWGASYVMLGGDRDQVPMRYSYCSGESSFTKWVPTDLYFSDLYYSSGTFAEWDSDGDGRFGEEEDTDYDLKPDVYISRLPASSASEASTLCSIIINYETSTFGQDWFDNFIMAGTDTFNDGSGTAEGEYCLDQIYSNYMTSFTAIRKYETQGTCSASQISTALNTGAGFIGFSDHGDNYGWGSTGGPLIYDNNDISSLSNGAKRPVVIIDACRTGVFDEGDAHSQTSSDGMVEHFVGTGHAIAGSGASRVSYGAYGTNYYLYNSGYFNARIYQSYNLGDDNARPGVMLAYAENAYVNYIPSSYWNWVDTKIVQEYVMFGDPTVQIGGFQYTTATLECGNNESQVFPGQTVEYNVTINNTGGAQANLVLAADAPGGLPNGWIINVSDASISVPVGGSMDVKLQVTASEDAEAFSSLVVNLVAESGNVIGAPLSIPTTTTVKLVSQFKLDYASGVQSVTPGGKATFNVMVTNTGNLADTVQLSLATVPEDFDVELSSTSLLLASETSDYIDVEVTAPDPCLAATYSVQLEGTIVSDPSFVRDIFLDTAVMEVNGLGVACDQATIELDAGDKADFLINVTNEGNHPDTAVMSITNEDDLPSDWTVSFKPLNTLSMGAYETMGVTLKVSTSTGTLAGEHWVKYRATLNSDSRTESGSVLVKISEFHDMSVTTSQDTVMLGIEETTQTFTIDVENLGNVVDDFSIDCVANNTEEGAPLWDIFHDDEVTLMPAQKGNVSIGITPGDREALVAGEYTFDILVKNLADNSTMTLQLTLDVQRSYAVGLTVIQRLQTLSETGNASFVVDVTNAGNGPGSFSMSSGPTVGWSMSFSQQIISLEAFESKSVTVNVLETTSKPLAGDFDLSVQVEQTDSVDTVEASKDITVRVLPHYGLDVVGKARIPGTSYPTNNKEDLGTYSVKKGEVVDIQLTITNQGNSVDTFIIDWDKDQGWGKTIPDVIVAPYGIQTVEFNITVADSAVAGDYTIFLIVTSDLDAAATDQVKLTITVQKEDSGTIPGVSDPLTDGEGNSLLAPWQACILAPLLLIAVIIVIIIIIVIAVRRRPSKVEPVDDSDHYEDDYDDDYDDYDDDYYDDEDDDYDYPPPPPDDEPEFQPSRSRNVELEDWEDDPLESDDSSDLSGRYPQGEDEPEMEWEEEEDQDDSMDWDEEPPLDDWAD